MLAGAAADRVTGPVSHPVTADGSGYSSPALTWTQGSHPVSSSFSGSVSPGGTSSQSVTATASGTVSASVDWSPSTTTGAWSGSTATLNCVYEPITVSASGPLTACFGQSG